MKETILKLVNKEQVSLEEAMSFIEWAYKIDNPSKVYDENITLKVLKIDGLASQIIGYYIKKILEDSSKYGLQVTILKNLKTNETLKITIDECK